MYRPLGRIVSILLKSVFPKMNRKLCIAPIILIIVFIASILILLPWDKLAKSQWLEISCNDNSQETRAVKISSRLLSLKDFSYIYTPKDMCYCRNHNSKIVIIVIHSSRKNFISRKLIRSTFGSISSYQNYQLHFIFLLGIGNPCEDERNENLLKNEIEEFGDILMGNFVDSYRNLSFKHVMGYKWVTEVCSEIDFYLKADDNILINIFNLVHLWNVIDEFDHNIYCSPVEDMRVSRDPNSISYVNHTEFDGDIYPTFCGNRAYTTRLKTVKQILDASRLARFFWRDDIFATGILREKANRNNRANYPTTFEESKIGLIRTQVFDYEVNESKKEWKNTTKKWIGLILPRRPPPYLICQIWKELLLNHSLGNGDRFEDTAGDNGSIISSCDSVI